MPEPLEEQLVLDISPALASIGLVDDALSSVISNFTVGLGEAFTGFQAQTVDVPVTADTSEAEAQIAGAGLDSPQTIPVDADTQTAESAVGALDTPLTVPIEADTTAAEGAIGALDTQPVTISVDADTSEAENAIGGLTDSVNRATGSSGGGEGLAGFEGALIGVKAATGAASGGVGEVSHSVSELEGVSKAAVGSGIAFTAFLAETINLAADAQAQNRRFAATFGDVAEQARQIDIGGLNTDLETLGKESGTAVANLEASATRVGLLGNAAGAAHPQIAATAGDLLGIAGALSVTNPRLGDAATVADTLSRAFSTGRTRALIPYGISLSQNAIVTEALRQNVGKTKEELTGFDKVVAGVTLVSAQFGDTLGDKFALGASNAQIQLRALKVEIEESLVAIGTPLLGPAVDTLREFVPVAVEVGRALGAVAEAILPLVSDIAPALGPLADVIGLVAQGVTVLSDAASALSPTQLILIGLGLTAIAVSSGEAAIGVAALTAALDANPLFLGATVALLALAALGGAFNLFHHQSEVVTADSKNLADALLDSAAAQAKLQGTTVQLSGVLNDAFQNQLKAGEAGRTAADGAASLGLTYADLTDILLSTDDAFNDFFLTTLRNESGSKDQKRAQTAFVAALGATRQEMQAGAKAALQNAVASKFLTDEQIHQTAAALGLSTVGGDLVTIYERLKPVIEAAAEAQNKQAVSDADRSGAFARLRTELAAGTITAAEATTALTDLGVSADDTKTFVDGVTQAVTDFIDSAVKALPTAGDAVDTFESGVTSAFEQVQKDVHDKTGNVKADLASLKKALDPAEFISKLFADAATVTAFVGNLKKLGEEGFTGLVAVLAEKGPEAGGNLAASLASDENKAKFASAGLEAGTTATESLVQVLQQFAPQLVGPSTEIGSTLGTGITTGFTQTFVLSSPTQAQMDAAGFIVAAATPGLTGKAAQVAEQTVIAFEQKFGRLPTVAEVATGKAHKAVEDSGTEGEKAGAAAGEKAAAGYESGLTLDKGTEAAISSAQTILSTEAGLIGTSHTLGLGVGIAFDTGIAAGISQFSFLIEAAATGAALTAKAAADRALGNNSPSKVGRTIGQQFVAGIAQGLSEVTPIEKAAAGLGDTLSGAVNPVVPNFLVPTGDAGARSSSGPSSLALDLVVHLQDGTPVTVPTVTIEIPEFRSKLHQRLRAEVQAG